MSTPPPRHNKPTGRRTGDSGTRETILTAALTLFAEHGYEGTSLRAIASVAHVDPALIRHFFGDKEALFAAAVADRTIIHTRLAAAVGTDASTAGRDITNAYLSLWEQEDSRRILLALVRSAMSSTTAADMLREALLTHTQKNAANDAEQRTHVALAAAHLFGVAMARHLMQLPPVADLSHDELVEQIAPTIQRYITGQHAS